MFSLSLFITFFENLSLSGVFTKIILIAFHIYTPHIWWNTPVYIIYPLVHFTLVWLTQISIPNVPNVPIFICAHPPTSNSDSSHRYPYPFIRRSRDYRRPIHPLICIYSPTLHSYGSHRYPYLEGPEIRDALFTRWYAPTRPLHTHTDIHIHSVIY